MDLYFTLEDFDCEDIRFLACKTLTPKEKPRLCLDVANLRGLQRVNKFHGNWVHKEVHIQHPGPPVSRESKRINIPRLQGLCIQ